MINKHNNGKNKKDLKCEIADIFMGISNKDNKYIPNLTDIKSHNKEAEEKFRCKFSEYLEVTSMWFQSILRLEFSPSTGNSDGKKMSGYSLKKLVEKVDEFHDYLSKNEKHRKLVKEVIERYEKVIEKDFRASKVSENYKIVAHRNLNKLKLILSDFNIFLNEKGIYPTRAQMNEKEYQYNLKLLDSLLKYMILLHKPIKSVFDLFN